MRKYETMFILDANLDEATRKQLITTLLDVFKNNGATVGEVSEWGVRELAYSIDDHTRGYYVVVNFQTANAAAITEFERICNINSSVIRQLTINL